MNVDAHESDGAPGEQIVSGEAFLLERSSGFADFLRINGFTIGIQEKLDMMALINDHELLLEKCRLRWALRSLLSTSAEQWCEFNTLFDTYWRIGDRIRSRIQNVVLKQDGVSVPLSLNEGRQDQRSSSADDASGGEQDVEQASDAVREGVGEDTVENDDGASKGGASEQASLATTDFRFLNDEAKMREAERLVERMAKRLRRYFVRRQRIQNQGWRIHLRRTIRNSLRYGGTPLELAFQTRKRKVPRLIMLLDVSRSMSLYSYFFLRFARGIVSAFHDSDAFIYHTRLVHVTDALRERDTLQMREKLAVMSEGWSGGTRIGDCLEVFNKEYGRRIINSRTVIIIVSDGYDTGEPSLLGRQLAEMKRRAKKIIWLNPLLGRDEYQPLAGGMQAAMPFIDLFAPAHNIESLQALDVQLASL